MAGSVATELAELLEVVERDRGLRQDFGLVGGGFDSGQIEHRVQQHGRVAVRKNEAVAIGPDGVGGIVAQKLLPQNIGDRGQAHGRAGMAGVGLLHAVNGQSADGVDAQAVELFSGQYRLIAYRHESLRGCFY